MTNTGTITASGGSSLIQSYSFDNENVISATNGDTLDLYANGVNNGTISVGGAGSRLIFNYYSLGGSGPMLINNGGTLEVAGGTLSDGVTFASGAVGTLQLDGPNHLTGTISGLAVGDVIAFAHATVTNAVVNGTTLAVTFQGGATENFTLASPLPSGDFVQTTLDGAGGTDVVVTNAPLPPPPTFTWADGTSGDWGTGSDWSPNGVPNGTNNASISGVGTETVTVSTNEAVNALMLDDANATLSVTNGAQLSVYGGLTATAAQAIDVANGTLLIGGGSQTLDGFTLRLGDAGSGTLTTDTASQTPAVLTLGKGLTVNAMNGAINGGNSAGDGVDNQGTVNVTGALSVNGYAVSNEGTISGGSVSIGNSQFSNSFINGNGGTISGITLSYQAGGRGNGNFTNNGSISETSSWSDGLGRGDDVGSGSGSLSAIFGNTAVDTWSRISLIYKNEHARGLSHGCP
jgi:hypothetical protein